MPRTSSAVPFLPLLRAGLIAAAAITVVNVAIYGALRWSGAWSLQALTPMGRPIDLLSVVLLSFVPPLLGAVLLGALDRMMPRASSVFVAVAAMVYLLFLFPPLDMGAPVAMVAALQLMNVVAVVTGVVLILRAYRKERGVRTRRSRVPVRRPR